MNPKRPEKIAAILITLASFGMILGSVEVMRILHSGILPYSPRAMRLESLLLLVGCANAVTGIAILIHQQWARRSLFLWTIFSLALFTVGTWAGRFFFDWQILSIVYRTCLVLYYSSAWYLLWTWRKHSLEA